MEDLKQQAEELGIKVDGRWSDERIQQEIDKALAAPAKPEPFGGKGDHDGDGKPGGSKAATVAVRIKRDIWDKDGNRHRKGTVIDLPVEDAMDAVEAGTVSRVKG